MRIEDDHHRAKSGVGTVGFFRGWVKRVEFFVDEPTGGFLMFFVAKQSRKTKQVEVTLIVFDPES